MDSSRIPSESRAYFDHAATSWPKPPGVMEAFVRFESQCGTSAGRSATRAGIVASQFIESTRNGLARFIGASSKNIAFCSNGTMALNAAILGMLKPGDHAIATAADHNSVLRPLELLKERGWIEWSCIEVDSQGIVQLDRLRSAIRPNTRLICSTHASNVTGAFQPIEKIGELAKENGIPFLLDAAQTIGFVPIDVASQPIDLLAAPGHKGLCGLLGTGVLYVCDAFVESFRSPWIGGTGSVSESLGQSIDWSHRVESGNLNTPALVSLGAGIEWLVAQKGDVGRTGEVADERLKQLFLRLLKILRESGAFVPVGVDWERSTLDLESKTAAPWLPLVSVRSDWMSPQDWSSVLDSSFGIETRAGLHCAGQVHRYLSTLQEGGTLRFSLGHTSNEMDLDRLEMAMKEIVGGNVSR